MAALAPGILNEMPGWPVPGVQIVKGGRKIQEEKKKNAGRLEGEIGREQQFVNNVYRHSLALASRLVPPPPPHFPGVQFDSLPTDRRALVSERLEQANARRNERVFEWIQ